MTFDLPRCGHRKFTSGQESIPDVIHSSQVAGYYFNFLSIFGGWRPNDLEAIALYRQDERLQMLSDMKDLIRLENLNAPRPSKELNRIHFGATLESR